MGLDVDDKSSLKGAWSGHAKYLNLVGINHISGTAEAVVVKFSKQVGYVKSQHIDDKWPLKGVWSGSRDPLYILGPPMISLGQLKLESSNFAYRSNVSNTSLRITNPRKGAWLGPHDPFSISMPAIISPERLQQKSPNFLCRDIIDYIKCKSWDYRLPPNGRGQYHVTCFLNFAPIISLESVKLGTSNVVYWLIQRFTSAWVIVCRRRGWVRGHVAS